MAALPSGTLILVRRGPLEAGDERRALGQSDPPPSPDASSLQVRAIERLVRLRPVQVLSSTSQRASATAEELARQSSCELTLRAELREQRLGCFEGRLWSEILFSEEADHAQRFLRNVTGELPLKGESFERMQARVWRSLVAAVRRTPREIVVAITHAGPIRAAIAKALDLPLAATSGFQLDPFGATTLRFDGPGGVFLGHHNVPLADTPIGELPT